MGSTNQSPLDRFSWLQGSAALAESIDNALSHGRIESTLTLFIFDFDRTLTNGFTRPGSGGGGVRGGQKTIEALKRIRDASNARAFVLTAREPRPMVVEQLRASLRHAQAALGEAFDCGDDISVTSWKSIKIAEAGDLFSCGYNKHVGINYIASQRKRLSAGPGKEQSTVVHFYDDCIANAHAVAAYFSQDEFHSADTKIISHFWDPFHEEFIERTMMPAHSVTADLSYQQMYVSLLSDFRVPLGLPETGLFALILETRSFIVRKREDLGMQSISVVHNP
mmetsp:Transcript_40277/g.121310  ORF Transcript_40277/g.121310 Transcript_40277/m.121310 type:complete len:280 (-) Transcript_40277:1453-2292(-)